MKDNRKEEFVICSNCFKDEGLKIDAKQIGIENNETCKVCKTKEGAKLTKDLTRDLCYRFFVRGTIEKCEYGGFPMIEMNEQHFNKSDIDVSSWLIDDVKAIEKAGEIGLFYYGPRFWMFGEIEPLKSLQDKEERDDIIEMILNKYPVKHLNSDKYFYRLRKDPKVPHNFSEYDTPPEQFIGNGRFDIPNFPILYGSQDLEICIHECRTTVEDNIFVGKLRPKQNLKLLDLTEHIEEENVTEFESLDMAIHFLFLAGNHSYEICRDIAKQAYKKGFDGIIYPSYFSYLRTGTIPFNTVYGISIRRIPQYKDYVASQIIPNLALFGRPIEENKVEVECVNKVLINKVVYETSFGPAYHNAYVDDKTNYE